MPNLTHIPLYYPLQAWFYLKTPITKVFMLCYARNFYYLLVLCYSHPMKAIFLWVTVYYERLFSNSQSPIMDEEQVLPRFDPFGPFRSLLKNGVQFLKLDSLSKSFCFKGAMGKMKCTAIYIPYVYQRSLSRLFNG